MYKTSDLEIPVALAALLTEEDGMKRVIRFASKWDAEGFYVLLNTASGVALPGNSYIVTDEQIAALRAKGIPFAVVEKQARTL